MRITEIQLLSNDLNATIQFYHDVLGFEIAESDQHHVAFRAGSSVLTFILSGIDIPIYHFAFNIPPQSLMDALEWTTARVPISPVGEKEDIADFKSWNAKAFYFDDNNGNILEFIARYDLDDKYEQPFHINSISSISEIAIVVDNVPQTQKQFTEKYGVAVFAGTSHENFAAMGNNNGLFIISQTDREWYGTHIKARSAWSKTSFQVEGRQYELTTK